MKQVPDSELKKRLAFDNPWWETGAVEQRFIHMPRRMYFDGFHKLIAESTVNRAVVLMGPRRVGKSVMIQQSIQDLLIQKITPTNIMYVSVDQPIYTGRSPEALLGAFQQEHGHGRDAGLFVFFDEIQYLQDWENHLKALVDSYPSIRFCVSGSAAAALKMKSRESGAGRFTEFMLPPLSFSEFLHFRNAEESVAEFVEEYQITTKLPDEWTAYLNEEFKAYINFGGFPEAVLNPEIQNHMDRYVSYDIVDKVLLRDIPGLYGLSDIQELKKIFGVLAYNSGMEINLSELASNSNIAKNTLNKYLEYLESAFLIIRLPRIDQNARRLKRQSNFKIYLTNPCLRAAMFGALKESDEHFGQMVETAVVIQLAQSTVMDYASYARWKSGEVDLVLSGQDLKPWLAIEIKWSDRIEKSPESVTKNLVEFAKKSNRDVSLRTTTKLAMGRVNMQDYKIDYVPSVWQAYVFSKVFLREKLEADSHPFSVMYSQS